jgi:RimJ/RimL family protein N-acetyltransferase
MYKRKYRFGKVMIKCGMIKEAEFKEYALNETKLKDGVQYRLLKYEWKKNNMKYKTGI